MSAMLAKRMGAKKVMVLIERRAYVDLVLGERYRYCDFTTTSNYFCVA